MITGEPAFLGDEKSVQKVLILLHKQTKWRFHLTVFVHVTSKMFVVEEIFWQVKEISTFTKPISNILETMVPGLMRTWRSLFDSFG